MNKREYMEKLLALCTEKERGKFKKIYPSGVGIQQLNWAITQIENTLKNLNTYKQEIIELKNEMDEISKKLVETECKLRKSIQKNRGLEERLNRNIELNPDRHRLEKLDALEAGGVDNWEFYDASLEQAGLI